MAGSNSATRMPMIAITTSSSTRVNPRRERSRVNIWNLLQKMKQKNEDEKEYRPHQHDESGSSIVGERIRL
jgi:hypothetical protein